MDFEATIEMLKQKARESWKGDTGERRAERLEAFLRPRVAQYAAALDLTEGQVLAAMEGRRNYSAINYYQEAVFPSLDGVRVFETQKALQDAIPSWKFRCPACEGVSTNPYECNSGLPIKGGANPCDWKSYGLFRTYGKGLRFTVKDNFMEHGRIEEIFMPLDMEETQAA